MAQAFVTAAPKGRLSMAYGSQLAQMAGEKNARLIRKESGGDSTSSLLLLDLLPLSFYHLRQ